MAKKNKKSKKHAQVDKTLDNKGSLKPQKSDGSKRPMILYTTFVVLFSLILFALTSQEWFESISGPISAFYAKASSLLINIFGAKTSVSGYDLASNEFAMSIKKGCDAIAPMILYTMAIVAFPVAFKFKWKSILTGLLALGILNIVRIGSLYFIGRYGSKNMFDIMHEDVWQIVFIVFTLFLWLIWMRSVFEKTNANAIK